MSEKIKALFNESIQVQVAAADSLSEDLDQAVQRLVSSLLEGRRVFSCGDRTNSFIAHHFTTMLLHGSQLERPPFPAIELYQSTNLSGGEEALSRQVTALGQPGDLLLAFVSHDDSEQVHHAMAAALAREMSIIAITGIEANGITGLLGASDQEIRIPAHSQARIIELQLFISQLLCDQIETRIFGGAPA